MKRYQNLLLLLAVAALLALPLRIVKKPPPTAQGAPATLFAGSDDQARDLIQSIAPGYTPWATPLLRPASSEVETLLFALQAALGSGFIGYYLGVSTTRARMTRATDTGAKC